MGRGAGALERPRSMQLQLAPSRFVEAAPVSASAAHCLGRRAARLQYLLDSRRRRRDLGARPHDPRQGSGRERGRRLPRLSTASRRLGRLSLLRFHLPAVHLHHRRLHRAVAAAPGRARRQVACTLARVAPRAAALCARADLLRGHQAPLVRHPLSRRAAAHRHLLPVRLADVPQSEPARDGGGIRGSVRRLLGADDFCAGARHRRRLVRARRQSRQLDRCPIFAGPAVGRDARSGRLALDFAGDRHLPARRVRRPAAQERARLRRSRNRSG